MYSFFIFWNSDAERIFISSTDGWLRSCEPRPKLKIANGDFTDLEYLLLPTNGFGGPQVGSTFCDGDAMSGRFAAPPLILAGLPSALGGAEAGGFFAGSASLSCTVACTLLVALTSAFGAHSWALDRGEEVVTFMLTGRSRGWGTGPPKNALARVRAVSDPMGQGRQEETLTRGKAEECVGRSVLWGGSNVVL
jgi:hypothetical protein